MSKELTLTPLQALKTIILGTNVDTYRSSVEEIDNAIAIIETALKEYEKLKKCYKNELNNVSYYNNLALKYKKIVDVIVAKEVDCNTLIFYLKQHNETGHIDYAFDSYNDYAKDSDKPQLTKEEFDLLKEVLL